MLAFDDSKILINVVDYIRSQGHGQGNGSSYIPGNKKLRIHCGRNGHIIDTFYRNHEFPPNFGKSTAMPNFSSLELN